MRRYTWASFAQTSSTKQWSSGRRGYTRISGTLGMYLQLARATIEAALASLLLLCDTPLGAFENPTLFASPHQPKGWSKETCSFPKYLEPRFPRVTQRGITNTWLNQSDTKMDTFYKTSWVFLVSFLLPSARLSKELSAHFSGPSKKKKKDVGCWAILKTWLLYRCLNGSRSRVKIWPWFSTENSICWH